MKTVTIEQALKEVSREIDALRKEAPLPPTPYVVAHVASRLKSLQWDSYDKNQPHPANIRALCAQLLRRGGIKGDDRNQKTGHGDPMRSNGSVSNDLDWEWNDSSRTGRDRFVDDLGSTTKREKLRKRLRDTV